MPKKTALITGISGQDGAYLARQLCGDYRVVGIGRNLAAAALTRLEYLGVLPQVELRSCDLLDANAVLRCMEAVQPDEVYNLAAQSSVGQSFEHPQPTFVFNTTSVIHLLEAIRQVNPRIKFYQASSSEMFGNVAPQNLPIRESLQFHPVSPYGISKASAHWLAVNYREAFGLFTACGILFNHESALRGDQFVIKKIINTALRIERGETDVLRVGNLAISRDWGYAPAYVDAMWRMLQQDSASDYVICSGQVCSLLAVVTQVFATLNLDVEKYVRLDPKLLRASDLTIIYGDNRKAKLELQWDYALGLDALIQQLIADERAWMDWQASRTARAA
jgi:GDPmannose 4,6-dehydratase